MIQLYDRDAAAVADVLALVADIVREGGGTQRDVAYGELLLWAPADVRDAPNMSDSRRAFATGARLKSIVSAINDQLNGAAGAT